MVTGISNFPLIDRVANALSPMSSDEIDMRVKQAQDTLEELISQGDHEGIETFPLQSLPRPVNEALAKAPLDAESKDTLLHRAANSNYAVMHALVKLMPDAVNTPNKWGNTPLMHAAQNNNVEAVQALLDVNANANARNDEGWTALMMAAFSGAVNTVMALFGYAVETPMAVDINAVNREGNSAFMLALDGRIEVAAALRDAGAVTDARNNAGKTPLMMAVSAGRNGAEAIELLKPTKEDLDQVDERGRDALRWAIETSLDDNVGKLLELGANPNAKSARGDTPLIYAINIGATKHAQTLMKVDNIDLNATDAQGRTALIHAARSKDWTLFRQLVDAGADYNMTDEDGANALFYIDVDNPRRDQFARLFEEMDARQSNKS